jgi:hypothetical protein
LSTSCIYLNVILGACLRIGIFGQASSTLPTLFSKAPEHQSQGSSPPTDFYQKTACYTERTPYITRHRINSAQKVIPPLCVCLTSVPKIHSHVEDKAGNPPILPDKHALKRPAGTAYGLQQHPYPRRTGNYWPIKKWSFHKRGDHHGNL